MPHGWEWTTPGRLGRNGADVTSLAPSWALHSTLSTRTHCWSRGHVRSTPGSNVSIQLGPRVRSYSGLTSEVLASFIHSTPRRRFLIDYWHGETIVLGVPGPVEIHSGTTRMSWLLRNDFVASTLVGAFRSTSLTDRRAIVYHGGVSGAWSFRENYTLTTTYRVDYQRGDLRGQIPPDGHVNRGVLLVGVTVAPRLTRHFRNPYGDPALPMTGVLWP